MAYSGIRTGISEFKKKDTPRSQRSMDIEGDEYTINGKTGLKPTMRWIPAAIASSGTQSIEYDRWKPPSVEIGFRASWLGLCGWKWRWDRLHSGLD